MILQALFQGGAIALRLPVQAKIVPAESACIICSSDIFSSNSSAVVIVHGL
jgi:hypothetical protein